MKNTIKHIKLILIAVILVSVMTSCYSDRSKRNLEYAPNMYNSLPLEPFSETEYWDTHMGGNYAAVEGSDMKALSSLSEDGAFKNGLSAQKPPKGTVPRGDKWTYYELDHKNPWAPYPYPNTTDGYNLAGVELDFPEDLNPNDPGVKSRGEEHYTIFCVNCHGPNGQAKGNLMTSEKFVGVPAYEVRLKGLSVGKMYHTLTYGKGVMGSHAQQLTPRERWEVIAYILKWKPSDDGATDVAVNN
ncbi:MAG: cytochrome c [Bacteroidota bacterium]